MQNCLYLHRNEHGKTSSAQVNRPHPVQIGVCSIAMGCVCLRHVIVEDHIDTLNVDTTTNQVS